MNAHIAPSALQMSNAGLLAPDGVLRLENGLPHQTLTYSANAEIYGQGEASTALYQVVFGTVRLYKLLADGRRQISAFHVAGEVFGFEAEGNHHFFAEAVGSVAVRFFRKPLDPTTSAIILPVALKALVRAQEHLLVIGRQSASERVAAFLVDMQERQGGLSTVELAMARSDIADYLGLTIETVSRIFSRFKERGLIRLSGARTVTIVRPDALCALCE